MRKGLLINLDRCSGCDSCIVACKLENDLPLGHFYNKVIAVGPTGTFPNVEKYWLPSQCQQCENPACVHVCPTAASYRDPETGMVLINKEKCIGCQFCAMSCPYGVRYLNEEERVVEKCTLCEQQIAQGELPQCVTNCVGMAKWFGDLDEGIKSFRGPRGETIGSFCEPFDEGADVHTLTDVGNKPSFLYILRDHTWQGKE